VRFLRALAAAAAFGLDHHPARGAGRMGRGPDRRVRDHDPVARPAAGVTLVFAGAVLRLG
jgi:hypothetical protein